MRFKNSDLNLERSQLHTREVHLYDQASKFLTSFIEIHTTLYVLRVLLNSGGGDTCNFFKVFPHTTYFDDVKATQTHLWWGNKKGEHPH